MRKKYLSLLLVFALLVLSIFPSHLSVITYAEGDPPSVLPTNVTNLLTNLAVKVTQEGDEIGEGGTFSNDQITIAISFGVPVPGDVPEPETSVKHGDYASWTIEGFTLVGGTNESDLIHEGTKLGTLKYIPLDDGKSVEIRVDFDGEEEVFDAVLKNFNTVKVEFTANLRYVGNSQGNENESYQVTILGKTFTVNVPAIAKVFTGTKTGVKNGDTIDWEIEIKATQGEQNLDLSGFQLVDNLTNVGVLKGDISVKTTTGSAITVVPEWVDGNFKIAFPNDMIAPVYVNFTTQIAEDFVTNGQRTITNTAKFLDGVDEKLSVSGSVLFENKWIEKVAGTTDYVMENGKLVAYITWYITVNHLGASLPNARIIDVIDTRLEFVESQWYEKTGENWTSIGTINESRPADDKYLYPNSPLNQNVQLRIKTRVKPEENIGHTRITIANEAKLEWDNGPGSGIGSGIINIGIGTNPISKSAGSYDLKNHTIPWTVTVQQSDVSVDLRVLDLLVYGSTFDYDNVSSIEKAVGAGSGLEDVNKFQLDSIQNSIQNSLTPSFRQKYKPGSFSNSQGLTHTVYTLKNSGGKAIADLLVVSEGGNTINVSGGTLENPQSKSFNFETIVTDPVWYLSNSDPEVINTAMLFSANNRINQRQASRQISPRSTFKDMLTADAGVNPLASKNNRTTESDKGFNYEDKSVVFSLFVNQNGVNATGGITTVDGVTLGSITVEDELPEGWEFVDIEEGVTFYLFNASGSPNEMTVGDRITEYGDILSSTVFSEANLKASFTFTKLEEPYVIFVKARPTTEILNGYFNNNKTTDVTNTLFLKYSQNQNPPSNSQVVSIKSQVLDKNMTKLENGVLEWTVSYRPYDIFQNVQVLDQYRLIDTLPEGLELYTDSQGNPDFSNGNFTVTEMVLNPSGYVANGPLFTEQQLKDSISYDNVNRKLIFTVPYKDKAFRLKYKTMVTANSGSLTNSVVLEGVSLNTVNTSRSYSVASSDASATMSRNGWVEIEKVNQNGSKLLGSRFTVFTADKSLALRTGVTNSQGVVVIRGLPVGNYILKETEAPSGYTVSDREYSVLVTNISGTVATSIDGKTGSDSNKIKVTNFLVGTSGNLKVSKVVSGNDADESKTFEFTLNLGNVTGEKDFIKTAVNESTSFGSVVFTNGSTVFSLKHNESITIIGLPKELGYTLTEGDYSVDGYETYINNSTEKVRVHTGTIVVDSTQDVSFENTKDTFGDLLIDKIVAGNAGDLDKQFTFVLKFENPSTGSYTYEGLGGKSDGALNLDTEGKALISLKHGESIKIKDLPKGLNYSVEEQLDSEEIYDVLVNGVTTNKATGTIADSSAKTIIFTNSKSTFGNLVVRKMVDGLLGELQRQFKFILQMGELEVKTYAFELSDSEDNVISSGDMTFDENNKAEFSLKNAEAIKIKGLPNRAAYSVTEEDLEDYMFETSSNESGSIVGLSTPEVVFRNTRSSHGTLEIEKEVTGNGGNPLKEFIFNLSVENLPDGLYSAEITNKQTGAKVSLDLNFAQAKATFILKHNEKLSINLPKDLSYMVTEEDYRSAGYTTQISGDSTGGINVNETRKVTFTNDRQVFIAAITAQPTTAQPTTAQQTTTQPTTTQPTTQVPSQPTTSVPKNTTFTNTPITVPINIPVDSDVILIELPENGAIEVTPDGNVIYTPNDGFIGRDSVKILIRTPDYEEEIFLEFDVEEIPLGDLNIISVDELPQTGERTPLPFYFVGILVILVGIKLKFSF